MNEPSFFPDKHPEEPDPLLADLEESIPQGVPNDTKFELGEPLPQRRESDAIDNDFLELDSLLTESVAKKSADEQYKKDRELARKGYPGLSKEEVEFCNSRMRVWEMQREWEADRAIAVFAHYHCLHCDTARMVFSRLMEHHQHRFVKTTTRWVSVKETKIKDIESVLEDREVPMCVDCMEKFDIPAIGEDTPWLGDVIDGDA